MSLNFWDYDPSDLEVKVSEMLVATSQSSDALICPEVQTLLRSLRENLELEVIFVSEFRDGMRVFKQVDTAPGAELIEAGGGSTLETSFCQYVVAGQLPQLVNNVEAHPMRPKLPATPFTVGAHLSTPIVMADGQIYGTLCSFSREADPSLNERDLQKLASVARVMARRIEQHKAA